MNKVSPPMDISIVCYEVKSKEENQGINLPVGTFEATFERRSITMASTAIPLA
jgi:hypothetical protein